MNIRINIERADSSTLTFISKSQKVLFHFKSEAEIGYHEKILIILLEKSERFLFLLCSLQFSIEINNLILGDTFIVLYPSEATD